MGFGFKTEIEVTLIAAEVGSIPTNEEIIVIAGSGRAGGGGDCAIVIKPARVFNREFIDLEKGMEIKEMLAIPRLKFNKDIIAKLREEKNHI